MDVCLSDTQAIQEALKHFVKDSDDLGGSLLDEITANDKSRKDSLKEINLYPKTMLLNLDYNHVGTIERAIQQKSFKSLNALVEYFFEMINTFDIILRGLFFISDWWEIIWSIAFKIIHVIIIFELIFLYTSEFDRM